MITTAPVSRATLEETVRWRLMSVCPVHVRMEEHVLTLLMGTTVTALLTLRYVVHAVHFLLLVKKCTNMEFYTKQSTIITTAYICFRVSTVMLT